MKLTLSPVRMDAILTASVTRDCLTLNAKVFDFASLAPCESLPRDAIDSPWIAGDVTRDEDGVLTVPLILPHGPDATQDALFPQPLELTKGEVTLPR